METMEECLTMEESLDDVLNSLGSGFVMGVTRSPFTFSSPFASLKLISLSASMHTASEQGCRLVCLL
ncbi:uncharacterized protein DS421_20g683500 [Arachis hypogaea]|nr:uncharacterized protein DS421_20g683500 [Arachis hypogaea]